MEHIPKKDLIKGKKYRGHCRNATEAVWNGEVFTYIRYKFGHSYSENIYCPEDSIGFDVFYAKELID